MSAQRSTTVVVLGLLGVVMGAVGLLTFGTVVGGGAVALVAVVAVVGWCLERRRALKEMLRFAPAPVGKLGARRLGVDATAKSILSKTTAHDGPQLLRFVPRAVASTVDRSLVAAVTADRSVLVALVGESKAGKTRCMFEMLRARAPDAQVFAPRPTPQALRAAMRQRAFRSRRHWSVLWLDDVAHFIDPTGGGGGLDGDLLGELLALPRVVIAITAQHDEGLELLNDAPVLTRLTARDPRDGKRLLSVLGQRLAEAVGPEGLGAACVAGPELLSIHRSGEHPHVADGAPVWEGPAVVECLIAAHELGLGSLSRSQLRDVYRQSGTRHAADEGFQRGLAWALTPLFDQIALAVGDDDALRPYDYIAQNAAPIGETRAKAEQALAGTLPVDDLLAIAKHAHQTYALTRALRVYTLALTIIEEVYGPDHPEVASTLGNLGIVQRQLGEFEAARATQTRALTIEEAVYGPDHPEVASTRYTQMLWMGLRAKAAYLPG